MRKYHFAFLPNVTCYFISQQMTFSLKYVTLLTSVEFMDVESAREIVYLFHNRILL